MHVDVENLYLAPQGRVAGGALYLDLQTPPYLPGGTPPKPDAKINIWGEAELPIEHLSPGEHILWVVPKYTSADPVGILTATTVVADFIYRSLRIQLTVGNRKMTGAIVHSTTIKNGTAWPDVGNQKLEVRLRPVWMKMKHFPTYNKPMDMVMVHTTRNLRSALGEFMKGQGSPHYIIDRDGEILKLVLESANAGHAAPETGNAHTHWGTQSFLSYRSIGIENVTPLLEDLTDDQYRSLIPLIQDLIGAHNIPRHRVIGHSDCLTDGKERLSDQRVACPGYKFDWPRLENAKPQGIGLRRDGGTTGGSDPVATFFDAMQAAGVPNLALQHGDHDGMQAGKQMQPGRFGGQERKGVFDKPIAQLQTWLKEIGYSIKSADGKLVEKEQTARAVIHFQVHFLGKVLGNVDSRAVKLDRQTAAMIYAVRQANPAAP